MLAGMVALAAACADEPVAPPLSFEREEGLREAPTLDALLTCTVDVAAGSMGCDPYAGSSSSAAAGPLSASLIVGSQHQFVRMANDAPVAEEGTWSANVTVQNLTLQPFATADGATADPVGVRVFFVDEPNNGVEVVNHDGAGSFLGSDPTEKYYAYSGAELGGAGILSPGEVSEAKRWEFELNGATAFQFSVLVSTVVPDPSAIGVHLTALAAGSNHTCAEGSDGNAYCWGRNTYGQVGDGTTVDRHTPTVVQAPGGVALSGLVAGNLHTCAEGSDDNVYCWGSNNFGQLGDGTTDNRHVPTLVQAPPGVTLTGLTTRGGSHTCAMGSDGGLYCWGSNNFGQLGDGSGQNQPQPVPVAAPEGVTFSAVTVGNVHTCALDLDGMAYCWGTNASGQLGNDGPSPQVTPSPVQMPEGVTFTTIAAGGGQTCALGSDDALYCWGRNDYGQLGDGTTDASSTPVEVPLPGGVVFTVIAAGGFHTCAGSSTGAVYCWGRNNNGQVGTGSTSTRVLSPVLVQAPAGVMLSGVELGGTSTCAEGSDGRTYCWGNNTGGKLGDGTTTARPAPAVVAGSRAP